MTNFKIGNVVYFYDEVFNMIRKGIIEYKNLMTNCYYIRCEINYRSFSDIRKCYNTLEDLENDYKQNINKEINESYLKINRLNNAILNYKG